MRLNELQRLHDWDAKYLVEWKNDITKPCLGISINNITARVTIMLHIAPRRVWQISDYIFLDMVPWKVGVVVHAAYSMHILWWVHFKCYYLIKQKGVYCEVIIDMDKYMDPKQHIYLIVLRSVIKSKAHLIHHSDGILSYCELPFPTKMNDCYYSSCLL